MGAEVEADQLGDEWKGYVLRVAGGNDKQGFPMKQGVLTNSAYIYQAIFLNDLKYFFFRSRRGRGYNGHSLTKIPHVELKKLYQVVYKIFIKSHHVSGRVRLLMSKGHSCYRPRRDGERKRKSVRGCIVDANLSVLALVIVRKGEQVIIIFQVLRLGLKTS